MRTIFYLTFIFIFWGCHSKRTPPSQVGDVIFRTSYNYDKELTDAEYDSLQKSKPYYCPTGTENKFYDLLIKKGFVSHDQLDTSLFNLHPLSFELPRTSFSGMDFSLETDTARGRQYLGIQSPDQTFKIDLGMTLLGDRWITLIDLDDDGVKEMLILDKYYVMNGDNFELKFYSL